MGEEKLLTVREVSGLLGVSEKEVMDLAENGTIPAYKIGGVYLRFRNDQVQEYRKSLKSHTSKKFKEKYPVNDRLRDFFYFNDFYILSAVLIFLLLVIILRG
ncbi:MAG: helix-turn-helix domain-containing protein [Candidatus Omnitrophota bacterium]